MGRRLKDWLDAYVAYTYNSEPPPSYHLWTGIGAIASTLQRKTYIKWGRSTLYPNLYIILVGPSGRARKGTAFEYVSPILKAVGVDLVQGAITREKLIRRIGASVQNFNDVTTGQVCVQCPVTCLSGELSVFLGQQNIKFLADLCDWYDCPPVWKYDTKNMGTDRLDGLCFNLIGATAPDWMPSIIPKEAMGGGFTSRVIWVVEENKGKIIPYPSYDSELEKALINDLEVIKSITGEFSISSEGLEWYENWYTKEEELANWGRYPVPDPQMSGYCARRGTLIKKLGMIMSASESNKRSVEPPHFERALKYMLKIEEKMSVLRLFGEMGTARYAAATEKVLGYIYKHKKVTRSEILNYFYRDVDLYTFKIVLETLTARGVVKLLKVIPEDDDLILGFVEREIT